ncbi:WYL domain-containing protein [Bacillus swezeyi]|uniref:WYL domain-containing protein n=1 Tax=Bacillus swezeyi TaxID=1925020 RepID=A0A5M8RWC2_9BACI|nr:WYL domain-containing protein [Bacillus swezeyi]KAA6452041.1 WYL domain-containing protein [Bacillus swezeyi]KAA6473728.1 WYL domain-containing protein [Bacillus swezeyi]TYS36259.1 WYL domain-containing protein [Bacillus swezeyi]
MLLYNRIHFSNRFDQQFRIDSILQLNFKVSIIPACSLIFRWRKVISFSQCFVYQCIGVYTMNGFWYCPAYCFQSQQYRVFRVDRVQPLVPSKDPSEKWTWISFGLKVGYILTMVNRSWS